MLLPTLVVLLTGLVVIFAGAILLTVARDLNEGHPTAGPGATQAVDEQRSVDRR
jgi:hypothetical protein